MTAKFSKPHAKFEINTDVTQKLVDLETAPFRELLGLLFSAMPDLQTLKHWSARNPDKLATMIRNIGAAAGMHYVQPVAPGNNVTLNLHLRSDSEIMSMIGESMRALQQAGVTLQLPEIQAERLPFELIQEEAVNAK
jgi:hypothetical protein